MKVLSLCQIIILKIIIIMKVKAKSPKVQGKEKRKKGYMHAPGS